MDEDSSSREVIFTVPNFYVLTKFDGFELMSWDFVFETELSIPLISTFSDIPMPTSVSLISNTRAVFHMASAAALHWDLQYFLRFLFRINEKHGPAISINGQSIEFWQQYFQILGPVIEWDKYDVVWPNPEKWNSG